jgi:RES domain-containing protein
MARRRTVAIRQDVAFRYATYDTPLWVRPNTSPGRWHDEDAGPTQYLALHPDGAWAELVRAEGLQEEADLALVRAPIWALRLDIAAIVDYSTFERAEEAGFPPDALIDDDYTRCQAEGAALRAAGYAGVLAPSAALPGCANATLFGPRVLTSWSRPTRLASEMAGCIVAIGSPAPEVASITRHFGTPHAGFAGFVEQQAERARMQQFTNPSAERQRAVEPESDESVLAEDDRSSDEEPDN